MYIIKLNNKETKIEEQIELDTTYKIIERMQERTKKPIEYHFKNILESFLQEKVEILADGLADQSTRGEFVNKVLNNLAPIKINLYVQMFLVELLSDGLTDEEKEEYFSKNELDQLIK